MLEPILREAAPGIGELGTSTVFDQFLITVCADPKLESEWIETLSQLEFVGFRKILNCHAWDEMDLSVLQHLSEEANHAYLLKRLVVEPGTPENNWADSRYSLLGWEYFQTLDTELSSWVEEREAYGLVSWAVERRVLWLYPRYASFTKNPHVVRVLDRILADEKRHGKVFDTHPAPLKSRAAAREEALWSTLETALYNAAACR